MKRHLIRASLMLGVFAAVAMLTTGCGDKGGASGDAKGKDKTVAKAGDDKKAEEKDKHSGWWCDEHGIPEEVCDLCSKKFRDAEKAKGNWCEHNRVKTSCFKCNPGLREKYAAEYKAKYGKEPPPMEDEKKDEGKKDGDKK